MIRVKSPNASDKGELDRENLNWCAKRQKTVAIINSRY